VGYGRTTPTPTTPSQTKAFRWTQAGGIVTLNDPDGIAQEAKDVSADGKVIVGGGPMGAWVWDQTSNRARTVVSILSAAGIDFAGHALNEATGVSRDGNWIVGWSITPESSAWVARWR
jgi:hypothetical protein